MHTQRGRIASDRGLQRRVIVALRGLARWLHTRVHLCNTRSNGDAQQDDALRVANMAQRSRRRFSSH
jgi:hypothetical protein